jgi:MerR family mercuric resistance operon transcriptional regulator
MAAHAGKFTIGRLSRQSGVNVETVRYYERIGLLPPAPRTEGGHRVYDEGQLRLLTFIRRSRELGFSLDQVRALLGLVEGGSYTCDEVRDLAQRHLDDVRRKIADLRRLETTLATTVERCAGGTTPDCPVIDALFDETS